MPRLLYGFLIQLTIFKIYYLLLGSTPLNLFSASTVNLHVASNSNMLRNNLQINRIHHGWSVEIGKSQPEGPSVPVGNEARRVSHWNDGPEG